MHIFRRTILILFPLFAIVLFCFLYITSPKNIDYDAIELETSLPFKIEEFHNKSINYEAQFEEIFATRQLITEDYELLHNAIVYQQKYIDNLPYYRKTAFERISRLKKRYDQLVSVEFFQRSLLKELEGDELYKEKDYKSALTNFEEALIDQLNINENFSLSSHFDLNRVASIKRKIDNLDAYPFLEEISNLEKKILDLEQQEEWDEASEIANKALALQRNLNNNFRGTIHFDSNKLSDLKTKYASLRSRKYYEKIKELTSQGDFEYDKRRYSAASSLYLEALKVQEYLNANFISSPYASKEKTIEFTKKSESAASYEIGQDILSQSIILDESLRGRDEFKFNKTISILINLVDRMEGEFPLSIFNDEKAFDKIKYLYLIRNDIFFIQDKIYDKLLPLPNIEDILMFKTEINQALYTTIANVNPSRDLGNTKPAESVSWVEANRFCERLSHIMGYRVRLPKEYEYREALGSLKYVRLENSVVSNKDASGLNDILSKTSLNHGFFHLLGNVSEWLLSEQTYLDEEVQHIGGHYDDSLEVIYTVPVRTRPRNDRSRLIGFRVVVEYYNLLDK